MYIGYWTSNKYYYYYYNYNTTDTHINCMWKTKGNDTRHIQRHNKTHIRLRFHNMITTSIKHKHQETTYNTEHRTQNCNWVNTQNQHTTTT